MKIGMNLLLWTTHLDRQHHDLLQQIRAWGYEGVEIPVFSPDLLDAPWAKAELRDAGLEVTTVTALPPEASLVGESAAEQGAALQHLRRCIECTRQLGGTLFCGPIYSPVGRLLGRGRSAEEWKRGVSNFRELGRIADANGVQVAVEPLNRFETYVLNTAADTRELLDEAGSDRLGILLDVFHANIEEKTIGGAVRDCGRRLMHLHVSENDRGIPGSGHTAWDELFTALNTAGYNGWIVVESFSQSLPEIAAATAIWRPLAPSSAAYAQDSIRFLRSRLGAAAPASSGT